MFSKLKILINQPLAKHLTMRVNQVAKYFVEIRSIEGLINSMVWVKKQNLPFFILGGGSNIVFIHNYSGLVIKNSINEIKVLRSSSREVDLEVSSGVSVSFLIAKAIEMGLSGFEHHQGLPGTVGGAIYMNSKWTKPIIYFSDKLISAKLLTTNGKLKEVKKDYFEFAYGFSILQKTKEIIISAVFRLPREKVNLLRKITSDSLIYRKTTQPFGVATSGCLFKNISKKEREKLNLPTNSAGYLIDQCGLKNYKVGGFMISPIHANFIVNVGKQNSRPEDLVKLVKYIKDKVKEKFDINLVEEVQLV